LKKGVNLAKVFFVWARSWVSFLVALIAMVFVWGVCYYLVARFAPGAIKFFNWGAILSAVFGLFILIFNEPIVALSMGAKRIKRREQAPELWDAVHWVTPFFARPVPRIYLVDTRGMNAFAFGWGLPFFSAVGATQGIIKRLSSEELKAVMAHEIGHIINKDILVSMAMTISVMVMALTGWILLKIGPYSSSSRSSSDSKGGGAVGMIVVLFVGVVMYGFGRLFGFILQMFVSRQREYAADASSTKIMGTSQYLVSALRKISNDPSIGSSNVGAAMGFLCTADPDPNDLFSTHPSMEKRLAALVELEF
jgi:heat shock protein HtpX